MAVKLDAHQVVDLAPGQLAPPTARSGWARQAVAASAKTLRPIHLLVQAEVK